MPEISTNNAFFALKNSSEAYDLQVPERNLKPVLTKFSKLFSAQHNQIIAETTESKQLVG